jgi:uncharacterized protein (TIGR02246 family)
MAKKRSAVKKPTTVKKQSTAVDAIHKLDAKFMQSANAKNVGSLVAAFYTEDAVLMPPHHPIVEGGSNIRNFLQGMVDRGFSGIKLETIKIESAGNLAYGRGWYNLSMTLPGGSPVQDTGKYIVIYRRQRDGSWKAVADIFNSDQVAQ